MGLLIPFTKVTKIITVLTQEIFSLYTIEGTDGINTIGCCID
jgi:hypothetical protein